MASRQSAFKALNSHWFDYRSWNSENTHPAISTFRYQTDTVLSPLNQKEKKQTKKKTPKVNISCGHTWCVPNKIRKQNYLNIKEKSVAILSQLYQTEYTSPTKSGIRELRQ